MILQDSDDCVWLPMIAWGSYDVIVLPMTVRDFYELAGFV